MGKVITVWGSPGSGKSMFSCILAKALTRDKRKAIIINAEISVPMLPVWLPEQIIQTNASVAGTEQRGDRHLFGGRPCYRAQKLPLHWRDGLCCR